jgi:hypothetical protein
VLDLITGALTAGMLHRFVDVFWVQPILYNQPAWIPWKQVEMDLMSAQYKYKQAKLDSENKNASITVRSCFYLVPSILVSFLFTDVLGALLTTYSKEDVFYAEKYNGWRYLIVFVVGLTAVNACFSYAGDLNQFTAALLAGGTYVEGRIRLCIKRWINVSEHDTDCVHVSSRTLETNDAISLQSDVPG